MHTVQSTQLHRRFSIAPMMACTDRHARFLFRLLTTRTLLYTEMVNAGAVVFGDRDRHLGFSSQEHPLALQLGGNDPEMMAQAAMIAEEWGYDEVNMNCGCPSPRVKSGAFGAALMAEPDTVAACVTAMRDRVQIPVTVKTRIGIDDLDSYDHLCHFIGTVAEAGCQSFTIHARKAWLNGLSPKENREIPPLKYHVVDQLMRDFPALEFVLNGGIANLDEAMSHLQRVHGVMLGRAAYNQPALLADVDMRVFGVAREVPALRDVVDEYQRYAAHMHQHRASIATLVRPVLGLFHGAPGARRWRRYLSEQITVKHFTPTIFGDALAAMDRAAEQVATAA